MNRFLLHKGFSLVEFIIVLVIAGILAAFVLPRFSNISDQAELVQVQGVAGALRSGVLTVKTLFNSQGHSVRVQNLSGYGDGTIDTNNIGYPIGTTKANANENIGIGSIGCVGVWNGILIDAPTVSHNNANQQYQSYRHTSSKICSFVYRGSGDNGDRNTGLLVIKYDSRDGSVIVCGQRADIPAC
jgi:prepilin-type N-terminal cleavage/methylation domain-containing protein